VIIEQGVIGGQLLPCRDGTHGDHDRVAGEADVGFAGVIEEQHHRLVLGVSERGQVQVVRDLDLRIRQRIRQCPHRRGGEDMTALDRHQLAGSD